MERYFYFGRLALLGTVLASCGGPGPEAPASVGSTMAEASMAEALVGPERGTIVGLRPLGQASEARGPALAQVLRAASGPGTATPSNATELVVRLERGGRDVALVQEAGLRLGQRVTLTAGARPMLVAAGGGS